MTTVLNGQTATWTTADITYTGTFSPGRVDGTFVGPTVCSQPYRGEFHGTRVGP